MPQAAPKIPIQEPITQQIAPQQESYEYEDRHERPRNIFIRVEDFRNALGSIAVIRRDLKNSDENLSKMEHMKASKEKHYDKLKSSLADIERKLIFIDKSLFKGE